MIDHKSRNGQLEEYSLLIEKLEPIFKGLPWKLIAIDGRPGSGKTTLGRFLAWWFNVSLIETDHFLIEGEGINKYRIEEITRIVKRRQRMDCPIVIEGVQILRQLAYMSLNADFIIYVKNVQSYSLSTSFEKQFIDYESEFSPKDHANFILSLDHK